MRQQVASLESSVLQHKQTEEALQESQRVLPLISGERSGLRNLSAGYERTHYQLERRERILGYESAEIGQLGSCITPKTREGEDKKELRTAATEGRAFDELARP